MGYYYDVMIVIYANARERARIERTSKRHAPNSEIFGLTGKLGGKREDTDAMVVLRYESKSCIPLDSLRLLSRYHRNNLFQMMVCGEEDGDGAFYTLLGGWDLVPHKPQAGSDDARTRRDDAVEVVFRAANRSHEEALPSATLLSLGIPAHGSVRAFPASKYAVHDTTVMRRAVSVRKPKKRKAAFDTPPASQWEIETLPMVDALAPGKRSRSS